MAIKLVQNQTCHASARHGASDFSFLQGIALIPQQRLG
jgi:hypothetical protein